MFAVDTNILIYAHFDSYPQHEAARAFCSDELLSGASDWCLGWQTVYEYARIVTHPKVHQRPLTLEAALADLRPYLECPGCHLLTHTPQHYQILEAVVRDVPTISGNLIHDCHYAALLKEHGVSVLYTADTDFKRFAFLRTIDPTRR